MTAWTVVGFLGLGLTIAGALGVVRPMRRWTERRRDYALLATAGIIVLTIGAMNDTVSSRPAQPSRPEQTSVEPPALPVGVLARGAKATWIQAADYGDAWPFTVPSGHLACTAPGSSVVLVVDQVVYALNGRAKGNAEKDQALKWQSASLIQKDDPSLQIQVVRIIETGLALCG